MVVVADLIPVVTTRPQWTVCSAEGRRQGREMEIVMADGREGWPMKLCGGGEAGGTNFVRVLAWDSEGK